MFNLSKLFKRELKVSKEDIAKYLQANPEKMEAFEEAYRAYALSDDPDIENFYDINSRQASGMVRTREIHESDKETAALEMIDRIVNDLVAETKGHVLLGHDIITNKDIAALPEEMRPQLTGQMMKRDITANSYEALIWNLVNYKKTGNKQYYHMFRQGLETLDLDPVTYEILGMNRNSMGNWFQQIKEATEKHGFFKIPETKIAKVPITMLQLSRLDYGSLTPATLKIVDDWAMKVFDLDVNKSYFIKTGVYSSKFDFRNCKVTTEKEVRELGEYLLYIQFQSCMYASPLNIDPKTGKSISMYGAGTTNEWVVREYIEDVENNPTIYKGLPLHTEYRVFVDLDEDDVIGISPYWRPDVMKKRFSENSENSPHEFHDYVTYAAHEPVMMKRYEDNKTLVLEKIRELLPDVALTGQWSVDIMQNGDDFWIIDMALAENSALNDCIEPGRLKHFEENWIPVLDNN